MKGYDATDEGLKEFVKDFRIWCDELSHPKKDYLKIDYLNYSAHGLAVQCMFKRLCGGLYEEFETVDWLENEYILKCPDGGMQYCEQYQGPCFGYDYKSYYPTILSATSFYIPTK